LDADRSTVYGDTGLVTVACACNHEHVDFTMNVDRKAMSFENADSLCEISEVSLQTLDIHTERSEFLLELIRKFLEVVDVRAPTLHVVYFILKLRDGIFQGLKVLAGCVLQGIDFSLEAVGDALEVNVGCVDRDCELVSACRAIASK
jgi:hypothetical protein